MKYKKIVGILIKYFQTIIYRFKYGYFGNYETWEKAQKICTNYEADVIINKVQDALLKVKNGEAVYERDSVIFEKTQYSWPLLASLLWIASHNGNRLNLIDFGGSLGSTFFQNRNFLSHLSNISWNIVEQPKFVVRGKKYFEDDILKFYNTIEECVKDNKCNTIILSSVLPYIEKPYELLYQVIALEFKYIIIDRTPILITDVKERLTIQVVPSSIYSASYPAWFFNKKKLLYPFQNNYKLIAEFKSNDSAGSIPADFMGFIFEAKS